MLTVVLLQGLLVGVFVFVALQQVSKKATIDQAAIQRLQWLSEAAQDFTAALDTAALDDVSRQRVFGSPLLMTGPSGSDLLVELDSAFEAMQRHAKETALQLRVQALKDAVSRVRDPDSGHLHGVDPVSSPTIESQLRDLHASAKAIYRTSARLAFERSKASIESSQSESLRLGASLITLMLLTAGLLWWFGRGLWRSVETLPKRVERMIYDEAPAETVKVGARGGDPIETVASEFWAMAQQLRSRLSENEKIERMAFTDALTGLPNRRGLLAFLDMLAENVDGSDESKIGLVHIDLDHFKTINDTMGHDAGDLVLREATKRMSTAIRDSDLLARLGGDEFLVVATGVECEADLTRIADRLTAQFTTPIMYNQRACHVGVSLGLVLGGQRRRVRDPKRLLINADMALFRAKSMGRGQYAIFNSAMADEARLRNERSIALGKALQDDAFHPWFQPMIDLKQGDVTGLELLCRWHDEERGILMPHEFLEDAEANSLMEEIGLRVLERAISALQSWRMSGAKVPTIHLNLSRTQLLSSSFVDRLSWTMDEANLPPGQFAIEVDERDCSARGSEVVFANIRRMRDLGLQIVLDNFGVEQGSLTILSPLGARMVKCNPATFEQMLKTHSHIDKVTVLSALAHASRSFGVIIGGKAVETEPQSALLTAAGIHIQQGDYLANVLGTEDTGRFLRGELEDLHRIVGKAS